MKYQVNNRNIEIDIKGETAKGGDFVLAEKDDNLIAKTGWKDTGYSVVPFLEAEQFEQLEKGLKQIFISAIRKNGFEVADDFHIEEYHKLPGLTQEKHLGIMDITKNILYREFPVDPQLVVNRISELVQVPLTLKNPQTLEEIFHLRIVRPGSSDFNPLHRDAWMDELKHSLNLYVGIAGSTEHSSLCLVPGSHLWPESEVEKTVNGAIMNGAQYNVPGLIQAQRPLDLVRPNPGYNEVMVFTPYLIHGGSANLNPDQTRTSLELRLWRKRVA